MDSEKDPRYSKQSWAKWIILKGFESIFQVILLTYGNKNNTVVAQSKDKNLIENHADWGNSIDMPNVSTWNFRNLIFDQDLRSYIE